MGQWFARRRGIVAGFARRAGVASQRVRLACCERIARRDGRFARRRDVMEDLTWSRSQGQGCGGDRWRRGVVVRMPSWHRAGVASRRGGTIDTLAEVLTSATFFAWSVAGPRLWRSIGSVVGWRFTCRRGMVAGPAHAGYILSRSWGWCVPARANAICWDDGDYSEKRGDEWGGGLDDEDHRSVRCTWLFDWSVSLFSSHTTPMQPLKRKRDELPTTPQKLRKIQLTIVPDSLDIPATPPPSPPPPPPPSPVGDGVVWEDDSERCGLVQRRTGGGNLDTPRRCRARGRTSNSLLHILAETARLGLQLTIGKIPGRG
ncbi:hypothetical protein EDB84DRAFT_1445623 [Lactarius hengduanensis]|nr:hypothetical protein EDB84DRAFT_1445623 [Lactarius hengduanensis]